MAEPSAPRTDAQVPSTAPHQMWGGRFAGGPSQALDALVDATQGTVTGTVKLKLYKGSVTVAGRESPYALYQPSYATFGKDHVYDQKDAAGFIRLYGLSMRIAAGLEAARQSEVGIELIDGVEGPEPQVGRDLVVARAAGVQLARQRADLLVQQPLDQGVDVFVGDA